MPLSTFLRMALAAALMTVSSAAICQESTATASYPNQTVRIVVPFSAGSMSDILGRILADKLGQAWHQVVIVENRPGISGVASVAKAKPDGYTLMLTSNGHTILNNLHSNLTFDAINDFVGVSKIASLPLALVVSAENGAKDIPEFIRQVSSSNGKLNYASAGLASTAYIAAALFVRDAKLQMVHVPYKGTPEALTSVMRGDTAMFFAPAPNAAGLINTKKVKALAVSGETRLSILASVPTFSEAGFPQFVYDSWFGILAPSKIPPELLQKINRDIKTIIDSPELRATLLQQGVTPSTSSSGELTAQLRTDAAQFSGLIPKDGTNSSP